MLAALLVAGLVVFLTSMRLTRLADIIADRTRLGEALVGATVLGAATSLSGMAVSFTAASSGDAALAFSNSVGGIAAQTLFLALADLIYRRANLEHAAADTGNLFQCTLLLTLLSLPLIAYTGPPITVFGIHPVSFILIGGYVAGIRLAAQVREAPMWRAVETDETREDVPEEPEESDKSPVRALIAFVMLMLILGAAGWVIANIASVMITRFSLSSSVVGALMTAVITSMPELVTTLAAVRRGALQLAIGGIIGGNTFDILFLSLGDIGYREGSLYHAIGAGDLLWLSVGMLMSGILLIGLIMRQRAGPATIGVESLLMMVTYGLAVAFAVTA
ncbi:sodium:calcium antiporter [Sulfitobacter sp. HNIBRBA3233]|uniref:sodium:calcium antiporter n=1 Tax=Sulfitobacter marinivivus TaxID=3158558 RepID=UPI0032DFCA34